MLTNQRIEYAKDIFKIKPKREELQTDLEVKIKTGQLNRREKRCINHKLKSIHVGNKSALMQALALHGIKQ
jgi:hypothetical protein